MSYPTAIKQIAPLRLRKANQNNLPHVT